MPVSAFDDAAALRAAAREGTGLCTITGIDGSFSRRVGAQLAIDADGTMTGSLADGCLESELAARMEQLRGEGGAQVMRFGKGSRTVDFRLPCGSGLDILLDPAPDRAAVQQALRMLDAREAARLPLPGNARLRERLYIPPARLLLFGSGPETTALANLAVQAGVEVQLLRNDGDAPALALGQKPPPLPVDPWTAIVLLFHDHEWEWPILEWALDTPAFLIGAQGGAKARAAREEMLRARGIAAHDPARIASPVGLIPQARDAGVLALSVLAQVIASYEALHPHR